MQASKDMRLNDRTWPENEGAEVRRDSQRLMGNVTFLRNPSVI